MQKNSTVDLINKELWKHGSNIYGDPIFRVVFSDDQIETRKGQFKELDKNLRKEVKKYPWIKGKWILERWADGEKAYHPDLVTIKSGVYICVYVFQDVNQNYLPPLLKVAQIVVNTLLNPLSRAEIKKRDEELDAKQEELEISKIELDLAIQSEEAKIRDPKSSKETMSVGYSSKEKI